MIDNDARVALNDVVKHTLLVSDVYESLHDNLQEVDLWVPTIELRKKSLEALMQAMRDQDCLPAMPDGDREALDRLLIEVKGLFNEDAVVYRHYFCASERELLAQIGVALNQSVGFEAELVEMREQTEAMIAAFV